MEQRIIKFRVFSERFQENKILPVTSITFKTDGCWFHADDESRKRAFHTSSGKVMQFTGLLDSKGVEIYEGDIIEIDGGAEPVRAKVGFEYGQFRAFVPWLCADEEPPPLRAYIGMVFCEATVIGNIHESPDLAR